MDPLGQRHHHGVIAVPSKGPVKSGVRASSHNVAGITITVPSAYASHHILIHMVDDGSAHVSPALLLSHPPPFLPHLGLSCLSPHLKTRPLPTQTRPNGPWHQFAQLLSHTNTCLLLTFSTLTTIHSSSHIPSAHLYIITIPFHH